MDPNDSVDDVPSDSLSMSSEMPEQDDMPEPRDQEPQGQEPQGGSYFGQAYEWASAHPYQAAGFGTIGAIAVVPAIVAGPALAAAGFGANGIIAGSAAAGAQSGIGSIVAPSLFATLQSAGAGGYGVAAVHSAVSATALGTGSVGALFSRWMGRRSNASGEGEEAAEGSASDGGGDGGPGGHAEKAQPETQDDEGPQGYADKVETKAERAPEPHNGPKAHL